MYMLMVFHTQQQATRLQLATSHCNTYTPVHRKVCVVLTDHMLTFAQHSSIFSTIWNAHTASFYLKVCPAVNIDLKYQTFPRIYSASREVGQTPIEC